MPPFSQQSPASGRQSLVAKFGFTRHTLTLKPVDDESELTVEVTCGVRWNAGANPYVYGCEFRQSSRNYYVVSEVSELESAPMHYQERFVRSDSLFVPYNSNAKLVFDIPRIQFEGAKIEVRHRIHRHGPTFAQTGSWEIEAGAKRPRTFVVTVYFDRLRMLTKSRVLKTAAHIDENWPESSTASFCTDGNSEFVKIVVESTTPLRTWSKVKNTFGEAKYDRAELREASVIQVSGDGDGLLLLQHFDSSQPIVAFPK